MHDEWVKHRSSDRFWRNMQTITASGVGQSLRTEISFITAISVFAVAINLLVVGYQDFGGVMHASPLASSWLVRDLGPIALPTMPFTVLMPALSLLLVFRTNTGYARWNEARTLWGGVVNNCRNVVRQANTFFPETGPQEELKERLGANTAVFAKALRNFLRGPEDDPTFRAEMEEMVAFDLIPPGQVDACMQAKNRPMFCLNAMSDSVRRADIKDMDRARMDQSISTLVDLTGACERIFKSPVPLVYTRHTSRFLFTFLTFIPFGLWPVMDKSWNHLATIPVTFIIAFFLLGIEEIGIQIEEPFSILPLEALCNGAIAAVVDELIESKKMKAFSFEAAATPPKASVRAQAEVVAPTAPVMPVLVEEPTAEDIAADTTKTKKFVWTP